MKITKSQLKQIIKEELESALNEDEYDELVDDRLVKYGAGYKPKTSRSYGSGISSADTPRPPQSAEDKALGMYKGVLQGYLRDPNTERRLGRPATLDDALRALISNNPELIQRAADELRQEMGQERPAGGGLGGPDPDGARYPTHGPLILKLECAAVFSAAQ